MKFKKFVKSLGADGILYVRENGDRWLSSGSIFMKVPVDLVDEEIVGVILRTEY